MLRIIDNKRINLTDDEFAMYQTICNGYTQGKDLFKDLFETDGEGNIIVLKAPKNLFSMEVVLYLQNIMVHQHLRKIYQEHATAMKEIKSLSEEVKQYLSALKSSKSE